MRERQKLELVQKLFAELFYPQYRTRLVFGANEPFYRAASNQHDAVIFSRHDYLSSALHEIAHWCLAGEQRRQKDDYGYWYCPDGRTDTQQKQFELVEVKPQAVEWALSLACRQTFRVSADNLNNDKGPSPEFSKAIERQLLDYWPRNLPTRAQRLYDACIETFCDNSVPALPLSLRDE
ncbi:MAG: elongation factor P hydroxylase [Kangiellaceae bacterium]|nr:elongation factor P hydroxylase [Kangiellaceae bacterium]